ncbi:MAG: hypothetical protein ABFD10_22460 [Prolixibacteraceae bacterium]
MKKFNNISWIILIVILLLANFALCIYARNEKSVIKKLNELYILKSQDEQIVTSAFEKMMQLQGRILCFSNDSLNDYFREQMSPSPLLFIKLPVCDTCLDALLLEIEKLRTDSLKIAKNLSVILLIDEENLKTQSVAKVFSKKSKSVFLVKKKDFEIQNTKEFSLPDMFLTLTDNEMKILTFFEFSERYPVLFYRLINVIDRYI